MTRPDRAADATPSGHGARAAPRLTCPVCSGPNACVPALRGDFDRRCWCETMTFSTRLLSELDETGREPSCICPACAAAGQV